MARLMHALRMARINSVSLATPGTAVTSLLLVPAFEVVLLVVVALGLSGRIEVDTAYASVVVVCGGTIIAGVVGEITRDRNIGVLSAVINQGLKQPLYFLSKVLVPAVSGIAVATPAILLVFVVSGGDDWNKLLSVLVILLALMVSASFVGVGAALLTLGGNDPYAVGNVLQAVLAVGTGVLLPIGQYPMALRILSEILPFTALVQGIRDGQVLSAVTREALTVGAWSVVAACLAGWVLHRWRSGKVRELLW
ncbi:ABC transporter permease [Pseudoclavibacter sp. RFBJ3]|uniref:ABC transporter permease n=1 Tax=unclassified Pseudoclavibacter TaxID=2615177 RepID=UPI000CE8A0DE|nr:MULTISPECIES: ABC transporter permease [unclassified Pseudoclavibacter]PPF74890.1 ABC transporter permease [Pseudoclavibacter sp. Z016]PPF83905.1 ABC transporter permease [Pseudoclavibacter sp. RFBJ5]PPF92185.1 ABC transporter permease [Pseudoclavibacter sp. RFBJ3]PPF97048.1 ABC transporter permease [Pseudoclavibacter sp. RFBH5]PPG23735.1 ABC transporter permease [Pseudoclavibacter sp. RFBI4]